MTDDAVVQVARLGFPWQTIDPFLFCAYHDDAYPKGDEAMAPVASLAGRTLGEDFAGIDGWRMYHGRVIPGFPQHPHRGFETVTVVRQGFIDHSDSLGATARFGAGDAQWMTAGRGIVHAEMFPLIDRDRSNPLELFQIWINLPARDKLAEPHFAMLWRDSIPRRQFVDDAGKPGELTVVSGRFSGLQGPPPAPRSWASHADSDVVIATLKLAPGARFALPITDGKSGRALYFFRGTSLSIAGQAIAPKSVALVRVDREVLLEAGADEVELLILQGRPIGEPVAQYGPFVMNTQTELAEAFRAYQQTQFGGWPWPTDDPVHPRDAGRFARHADGKVERG